MFSIFGTLFTRRFVFWFAAEKLSSIFLELGRGGQTTRKNKGFFGCLVTFFLVVPLVSSWSPIVFVYLVHCKSVTHLVFLLSVFCLLFGGCVSLFVSIFVFIVLFIFDYVASLSFIFSLCDQKTHQVTEYLKC